jgi:hypothetical protein
MIAPADTTAPLCACGCGQPVTQRANGGGWNRYLPHHAGKSLGDYDLDARCAALVGSGLSNRAAGEELGISHANVHSRVQRYESMQGVRVERGAVPEQFRFTSYAERVEALDRLWQEWQTLGGATWDRAKQAVAKLRRSSLDARNGGEWIFRRFPDVSVMRGSTPTRGTVEAKWIGVPCTNCGAAAPDAPVCPLCGYEREAA